MQRHMLRSKIHRVRVTDTELHYVGSVTIDSDLLKAADIVPFEKILIINVNNGARFETYALEGQAGSGVIGMNGGTARHCNVGDIVLICTFTWMDDKEAATWVPKVVFADESNKQLDSEG